LLEEETKKQWSGSFHIFPDAAIREEELEASKTVDKIEKVKNYVKENFRSPIKIADVTRATGVAENNFSRFFKQLFIYDRQFYRFVYLSLIDIQYLDCCNKGHYPSNIYHVVND